MTDMSKIALGERELARFYITRGYRTLGEAKSSLQRAADAVNGTSLCDALLRLVAILSAAQENIDLSQERAA